MKKYLAILTFSMMVLVFIQPVFAVTKVNLIDGKKFIDYELTNQSRKRSLKTLNKDFNHVFSKLSEKYLDEGQSMSIDVTNLDLAGYIRFNVGPSNQDIRVVKDVSPMKLYFNFKVKDKDGRLIKEGQYKIKEFLDLSSHSSRLKHKGNLGYFIPYLKKWFKSEFTAKA